MYIIPQRAKKSTNKIIKFDKKFTVSGVISIYLAYTIKNEVSNSRAAGIFSDNLKVIYPDPDLVNIVPNTSLAELRLTRAPSNLIELAYHDNLEDALWIVNNIDLIARTLVLSLTEYFEIPFNDPY